MGYTTEDVFHANINLWTSSSRKKIEKLDA